jgi:hypothetical protein
LRYIKFAGTAVRRIAAVALLLSGLTPVLADVRITASPGA